MLDVKIETFLAVCRNMSFTKAANELFITQPAVSQHIKYLEKYYGTKLFSYSGRKLSLTEQGALLCRFFETIHHDTLRIEEMIKQIPTKKTLRLGATMSIGGFYLPDRLSRYMRLHPHLHISLIIQDTKDLLNKLDNGEVDLVLCEGYFNKAEYGSRCVQQDEIICLCAKNYPIPNVICIEDLFEHRVILRESGSGTREVLERMLRAHGYETEHFLNRCEVNNPHIILQLLCSGIGVSFLYRTVGEKLLKSGELKEIQIPDFQMEHEFNAVWNQNSVFTEQYQQIMEELLSGEAAEYSEML